MKKPELNHSYIQIQCPKAWGDFNTFYNSEYASNPSLKNINFIELPFEMQLGVMLRYFNDNGIEVDLSNTDLSILPDHITEAFKTHENVISHFS